MRALACLLAAAGLAASALAPAAAETLTAASQDELMRALRTAESGDRIELAPGDYGRLKLDARRHGWLKFPGEVTIASAEAGDPARFGRTELREVRNLTFDGVIFDYVSGPGAGHWIPGVEVVRTRDVTIRNSDFDGDLAHGVREVEAGHGTGYGLLVKGGSGFTVENSFFDKWNRAMIFSHTSDLTVRGNEITQIRVDGMNFVNVDRALIEGNRLHNFDLARGAGDHRDMIQFWTNKSDSPSTDVTIRSNTLDSGDGGGTHSIFIRNEEVDNGRAGREMFYRNIVIEKNFIRNRHYHGITVGETVGLTVRDNEVLQTGPKTTEGVKVPRINLTEASENVTVTGNVAHHISMAPLKRDDWQVRDNEIVPR
jgi:hypothetical protein